MDDMPQRAREPELKEILISLQNLSSRFDELTIDLKSSIQSIYNPPELELSSKPPTGERKEEKSDDMIGCLNEQINKLKDYGNRLENLLRRLRSII
jgi:hypothetical protein